MKKLLLITVILLLQSFSSYSKNILNKGFICETKDIKLNGLDLWKNEDVFGFGFFEKEKFDIWLIDNLDTNKNQIFTELIRREFNDSSYRLWEDQLNINWKSKFSSNTEYVYINRYNLTMRKGKKNYQCKLYSNKSTFQKQIVNYGNNLLKRRKF